MKHCAVRVSRQTLKGPSCPTKTKREAVCCALATPVDVGVRSPARYATTRRIAITSGDRMVDTADKERLLKSILLAMSAPTHQKR